MTRNLALILLLVAFLGIPSSAASTALKTWLPSSSLASASSAPVCTCLPDCPVCHGHMEPGQVCDMKDVNGQMMGAMDASPSVAAQEPADQSSSCDMASAANQTSPVSVLAQIQAAAESAGNCSCSFKNQCGGPGGNVSLAPSGQEGAMVQSLDSIQLLQAQLEPPRGLLSSSVCLDVPNKPPTLA